MVEESLTARAVADALEERIIGGTYGPGTRLPSVRRLAAELGASPTTAGRALQELEQRGLIRVSSRRGAYVAESIPRIDHRDGRTATTLRQLVLRWRLSGGSSDEFLRLTQALVEEAYRVEPTVVLIECNDTDLELMSAHIRQQAAIRILPMLIDDARDHPEQLEGMRILTTFFHLAEVRQVTTPGADLTPLNFVPSPESAQALVDLDTRWTVAVIGRDERSLRRITGIVNQFSPVHVEGALVADAAAVDDLIDRCDAVVVTHATRLPAESLARARRVVVIEFVLERGGAELAAIVQRSAVIAAAEGEPAG